MNKNFTDMKEAEKLRDMINKSREVIREQWYEKKKGLTEEEENILFREMKKYGKYGDDLYRDNDLVTMAKKMERISEYAEEYLNSNVDEAFDRVTINRNIKEVNQYIREFKKIAQELKEKEERLQALYEDVGVIFNRYFDVEDRDNVDFDE